MLGGAPLPTVGGPQLEPAGNHHEGTSAKRHAEDAQAELDTASKLLWLALPLRLARSGTNLCSEVACRPDGCNI